RRTVRTYQERLEEHSTVRPELGKLCSHVPLANSPGAPGPVQGLESLTMKTPARLIQKFKIDRHGDHILVVVPLLADLEVTEDFARHIGFQRSFHHRAENLFRFVKIGLLRRDV